MRRAAAALLVLLGACQYQQSWIQRYLAYGSRHTKYAEDREVEGLIHALHEGKVGEREIAFDRLAGLGPRSREFLALCARHRFPEEALPCLKVLVTQGGEENTALVRELAAEHRDPAVRAACAEFLVTLEDDGGVPILVDRLRRDESPLVRRSAARALGLFGDARARWPLWNALSDREPSVVSEAHRALGLLEGVEPPALPENPDRWSVEARRFWHRPGTMKTPSSHLPQSPGNPR